MTGESLKEGEVVDFIKLLYDCFYEVITTC